MAMLHDVFDSVRAMTLLHLLLAFLACTGYMLAEGQMMPSRARAYAALIAAASAAWFVIDSPQWTAAAMLVALAIGVVGVFTAVVWGVSAALGLRNAVHLQTPQGAEVGAVVAVPALEPSANAVAGDVRPPFNGTRPGPLHSH